MPLLPWRAGSLGRREDNSCAERVHVVPCTERLRTRHVVYMRGHKET
jgi:hypothetical protein